MNSNRILAITSRYKHHGENAGYIQLKKYLHPSFEVGIDETKDQPQIIKAYKWLFEFYAWFKFRNKADLLHIYYGEEYYRFSSVLFRKIPIIATFHQPPEKLKYEVLKGGDGGRIYRLAHILTKNRFKKLSAAIVLEEGQKKVLELVMPAEKIHVIYHGIYTNKNAIPSREKAAQILTIGNWLRDWEFYERVVSSFEKAKSPITFMLINQQIDNDIIEQLSQYRNFKYFKDASDEELEDEIQKSIAVFLPLKSAAGNNAVMESLALGTPLILPKIFHQNYQLNCKAVRWYDPNSIESITISINELLALPTNEIQDLSREATKLIAKFDWSQIAKQTSVVYNRVLQSNKTISL